MSLFKKTAKIILGIFILLPFFQGFLISLFLLSGENSKFINNPNYEFSGIFNLMVRLFPLIILTVFLIMLISLIYLYKSEKISIGKKKLWSGLLVVGNIYAFPFFWYWYIWKDN